MRYVLGILMIFALLTLILFIFSGGNMWGIVILIDLSTIGAFLLLIFSVIFITGDFKTFTTAVNALLSKRYKISASDKEKAIRLFKLLRKSVTYFSLLLLVISITYMLRDLDDLSSIGINLAMSLIVIFYGLVINLAFLSPAIYILEARYNAEVKTVISEKQVIDKMLELCYKQGISPEEVLEAGTISFEKR